MKSFNLLLYIITAVIIAVFAVSNLCILNADKYMAREYRVQIERAAYDIEINGLKKTDLTKYPLVISVSKANNANDYSFLQGGNNDYILRVINGELYRFDYTHNDNENMLLITLIVNISLGVMAVLLIGIFIFLRFRILAPFYHLRELPYELSKGNLNTPLKESKSRYFGRFIWGMDLLRERLEVQKQEELRLQKENKTLLLSIMHDIKTPLSAIKLHAKALSKNLYEGDRQIEISENINDRADDIEGYLSQLAAASNEDFLNLKVCPGEFYMSSVIDEINIYYKDKLGYLKVEFVVEPYSDCLIKGDRERAVEVLQNIMENAVKYGAGSPVNIAFSDEEDCRLVTISNAGCTLSDNEILHIFDSFWRGSNSEKVPGSGLGLYICRKLMQQMDGEVFAEKEGDVLKVSVVFRKL